MDILFLIGRLLFGGFFLMTGFNHFKNKEMLKGYAASKGVPSPGTAVTLSGVLLVLAGLGIVLGLFVEIALWLLVIFLVPTSFMMHKFWKVSPDQKMQERINFMKNMALTGAVLMILFLSYSGWPLSL